MQGEERYQIGDIDNEQFYMLTKGLFMNPLYKGVSPTAKVIYAILKDRMELSRKNGWHDENGDIYLLFSQDKLAEFLNLTTRSIRSHLNELKEVELIESVRQGLGLPNKVYIKKCKKCISRQEENFLSDGKKTSGQTGRKLPVKSGRKFPPNDTEYSDTEYSETERSETENNKKGAKSKKCTTLDCSPEFAEALNAFAEMRKEIKKKLTDRAKKMILAELQKLAPNDEATQIAILNQSTMNSWQGVYPLHSNKKHGQRNQTANERADDVIALMEERGLLNDCGGETGNSTDIGSVSEWISE